VRRIGVLMAFEENDFEGKARFSELTQGLAELGWTDGRNMRMDVQSVRDGGLLAYGVDRVDLYRRAATYVDRILRGAKPAELPVQFPIKFEMAVNLKTAKALGPMVPQSILLRADEVIE
jgi:putative ABC transport system substrate-binding protein